MKNITLLWAQ